MHRCEGCGLVPGKECDRRGGDPRGLKVCTCPLRFNVSRRENWRVAYQLPLDVVVGGEVVEQGVPPLLLQGGELAALDGLQLVVGSKHPHLIQDALLLGLLAVLEVDTPPKGAELVPGMQRGRSVPAFHVQQFKLKGGGGLSQGCVQLSGYRKELGQERTVICDRAASVPMPGRRKQYSPTTSNAPMFHMEMYASRKSISPG